jgi:hypothetical protein
MSPLANDFVQALQAASIAFERHADGTLRIPARSSEVGDLVVSFDEDEITFFIGHITHQHFTPGARGDPEAPDQVAECIREAVQFLRGVLDDRWVLYCYPNGGGGCYEIGEDGGWAKDAARFLWSGPYRTQ